MVILTFMAAAHLKKKWGLRQQEVLKLFRSNKQPKEHQSSNRLP